MGWDWMKWVAIQSIVQSMIRSTVQSPAFTLTPRPWKWVPVGSGRSTWLQTANTWLESRTRTREHEGYALSNSTFTFLQRTWRYVHWRHQLEDFVLWLPASGYKRQSSNEHFAGLCRQKVRLWFIDAKVMSVSVKYRVTGTEESSNIWYSYSPCSDSTDCRNDAAVIDTWMVVLM